MDSGTSSTATQASMDSLDHDSSRALLGHLARDHSHRSPFLCRADLYGRHSHHHAARFSPAASSLSLVLPGWSRQHGVLRSANVIEVIGLAIVLAAGGAALLGVAALVIGALIALALLATLVLASIGTSRRETDHARSRNPFPIVRRIRAWMYSTELPATL